MLPPGSLLFDNGLHCAILEYMKLVRNLAAAFIVALWLIGGSFYKWLTTPETKHLYQKERRYELANYRYKSDLEIDYALLWSFHQSKLDGRTRFVYDSVKGVAVSMERVEDGKNYFTDGQTIGLWPAKWDEGFREREIEARVLNGPELQFGS